MLLAGGFAECRPHLERVLALSDPAAHGRWLQQTGSHPLMTQAFLGLALFCLGFPDQAIARSLEQQLPTHNSWLIRHRWR